MVSPTTQQIAEFIKCKNDFDYYCENYVYIEIPGGDILLKPYKKQKELIHKIINDKYVLVLKSRQVGISTIIQAYCSWLSVFYDNTVVGIISKDGKEATDFARTIRGIIEKLPDWMKPRKGASGVGFDKYTEQSFILTNGSKVFASTVNPNAPDKCLRGKAITFLVIDEAAFIRHIDLAWTSLVPSLSTSQKHARAANVPYGTVILSTPNKTTGIGKWFYSKYQRAISSSEFEIGSLYPFTIHWKDIEELANDPSWYKTQCSMFDNDQKKIEQELELKFIPVGGSFFDEDVCVKLQNLVSEPIDKFKLFAGEVWVFKKPEEGKFYIIGVDTASEFGGDKSAITIWDYQTLEQVWEYQGKLQVLDFVKVVKYAMMSYPGVAVVENNSYGNQVTEEINNSDLSPMLYKEKTESRNIVKPGLSNNIKTRPLMIDALYSYISQFPEIVKSKRLALELIGLVEKNGKVQADSDCNDDLALTVGMIGYVRKYDPPLMIDSSKFHESLFSDVMNMNLDNYKKQLTSSQILSQVKEKIDKNPSDNFVDILSLYNSR